MPLIERTRPNIHRLCGKMFVPGINMISNEEFDSLQNDKGFHEQRRLGFLRVIGDENNSSNNETRARQEKLDTIDEDTADEGVDITTLKVSEAVKIISEIDEVEDLRYILKVDARKGVQVACQSRVNALSKQVEQNDFEKLTVDEALDVVKRILSIDELQKVKDMDSRSEIQSAVNSQIAELRNLETVKGKTQNDGSQIDPNKVTID